MKEIIVANPFQNIYSKKGKVTMPDGPTVNPEVPNKPVPEVKKPIPPAPARRGVLVEEGWKKAVEKGWAPKERAEFAIKHSLPFIGGAEAEEPPFRLDIEGIDNPQLQRLGIDINSRLEAFGPDLDYLTSVWDKVGDLADVGEDQQNEFRRRIGDLVKVARSEHVRQRILESEEHPGRGLYGEHRLTGQERRDIDSDIKKLVVIMQREGRDLRGEEIEGEFLDQYFNNIFLRRTDARQKEEFKEALGPGGDFEYREFLDALATSPVLKENPEVARVVIRRLIDKYTTEKDVRELMHNAYFVAETQGKVEDFTGYCSRFASSFVDNAFFNAPEVEAAVHALEFILYRIKSENNGFIPSNKVEYMKGTGKSEFIDRSYKLLQDWNGKNLFGEKLPEWKLLRALTLARGFEMITLRLPEIVAECKLPAIPDSNESQVSIPWETISWELNPWDHKYKRYKVWRELRSVLYTDSGEPTEWWQKWDQQKIKDMLAFDVITGLADDEKENKKVDRIIDTKNLFKIGGPFTHSGWRSFVSALSDEKGGERFKEYLGKHAGLQLKQLWNRYLYKDLMDARDNFVKNNAGRYESKLELEKAWERKKEELEKEEEKKLKARGTNTWKEKDYEEWEKAAERIPYVVLRIITDEDNRLLSKGERERLLEKAFGLSPNDPGFNKIRDQVEQDLALAKEHLLVRRGEGGLDDPDWAVIPNGERLERAKKLQEVVKKMLGKDKEDKDFREKLGIKTDLKAKILDAMENRRFPFALTTEDVPFSDFNFAKTGTRGFITRRINDFQQEVLAGQGLSELLSKLPLFKSPEEIVLQMAEIFKQAQVHDFDRARDAMAIIAKGIIRLYQKDTANKVPLYGRIRSIANRLQGKGESYAQTVYGPTAMAWNSTDIYNFTELLRATPMFMGDEGLKKIKELRKKTGGRLWQALGEKTRLAAWLLILIFGYELTQATVKQKAA